MTASVKNRPPDAPALQLRPKHLRNLLLTLLLVLLALIPLAPFYFVFTTALKDPIERLTNPFGLPLTWHWEHFADAFNKANLLGGLQITLILTAGTLVVLPLLSSMAAYPLARRTNRTNRLVYYVFLSGLVLSPMLAMVPMARLMATLHLERTLHGVILLYVAFGLPFSVFLYTGFIKTLPRELDEAAAIDGCNRWTTFWRIVFPLLRPATATALVFNGLIVWNDFFWPLLFLNNIESQPLMLRVFSFQSQYSAQWELIFAGAIMAVLPILLLYLVLQRLFVEGIAAGSLKG